MPGGLLNIVSFGNQNIILNGNPSKTFFKCSYSKYTNFGLQKFRIDFDGQRTLRLNEESKFTFTIPRYADLLMDTYIVINLPTIWSPIYPPQDCSGAWSPYEFKWIKNLGTQIIKEVTISVGGQTLQQYTGQYLYNLVERDFSEEKKQLYYDMTGNVNSLNDPANSQGRVNAYPNAFFTTAAAGPDPSIRARKLYIPINSWFTLMNKMAFPLVSLQYNQLNIEITLRPIKELFQIRDVTDPRGPYVQPNFNEGLQQFFRFLQPPPDISLNTTTSYVDKRTLWNADIHLLSTYCFLSKEEVRVFAKQEQNYLIKEVYCTKFQNMAGTHKVELDSLGMVSNWSWFFQRNDAYLRNEWSNYTNWPYNYLPYNVVLADGSGNQNTDCIPPPPFTSGIGPGVQWSDITNSWDTTGIFITPTFNPGNQKDIMTNMGILLDGKYRENVMDAGIYKYIEKYTRTSGNANNNLYFYNFGLKTHPYEYQPSGAMNMSKFSTVELEFTTNSPTLDPSAQFLTICDPSDGIIGVNKTNWQIYDYNYDLTVFEERYNILKFLSGNAGLMYAR
jgi:hypothetical protein